MACAVDEDVGQLATSGTISDATSSGTIPKSLKTNTKDSRTGTDTKDTPKSDIDKKPAEVKTTPPTVATGTADKASDTTAKQVTQTPENKPQKTVKNAGSKKSEAKQGKKGTPSTVPSPASKGTPQSHLSVAAQMVSASMPAVVTIGTSLITPGQTLDKTVNNLLTRAMATPAKHMDLTQAVPPGITAEQLSSITAAGMIPGMLPGVLPATSLIASMKKDAMKLDSIPRPVSSSPESVTSGRGTPAVDSLKMCLNRKRMATEDGQEDGPSAKRDSDDTTRDDEDEDDGEDDEKCPEIDQERLKAFNMFVRLFVDENLDRVIPISKQPKDKVQAILDACDRQFPEFHERSRKRIRTYLKSCRRMRRSKDNGWEAVKPTPPHLTSAAAEGLLAQACENETQNAKRMKMGLDPLPAKNIQVMPMPVPQPTNMVKVLDDDHPRASPDVPPPVEQRTAPRPDIVASMPCTAKALQTPSELAPLYQRHNSLFLSALTSAHTMTTPPCAPAPLTRPANITNGPTDLSMKKPVQNTSHLIPEVKKQLNASEVTTIRQLISGYRESAAFLYRSADELEQLLIQQN